MAAVQVKINIKNRGNGVTIAIIIVFNGVRKEYNAKKERKKEIKGINQYGKSINQEERKGRRKRKEERKTKRKEERRLQLFPKWMILQNVQLELQIFHYEIINVPYILSFWPQCKYSDFKINCKRSINNFQQLKK